jgi:hypothetical protein
LPDNINELANDIAKPREEKCKEIISELEYLPKQALNYTYKQVTAENLQLLTRALNWLLCEKFEIDNLSSINEVDDYKVARLHLVLSRITEEFNRPEIVMGIVEGKRI